MSFTSEQSILIFIVLVLSILLLGIVSINKRKRVEKQNIKSNGNSIITTIIDRQVRISFGRYSILLSDPQFRYICKDFNTEILYKSEWATEEYSPGNTVSVYIDPAKSDIYFVDLSSVHPGSSPYQQAIEKEAIKMNHLDTVLQAKNFITKGTAIMALLLSIMLFLIFGYITITQCSIGLLVLVCIFGILLYATLRWTIYQFLSSKSKDL